MTNQFYFACHRLTKRSTKICHICKDTARAITSIHLQTLSFIHFIMLNWDFSTNECGKIHSNFIMYVSIFNHPILNDLIDSVFKVVDFNSTKMEIYIFFWDSSKIRALQLHSCKKMGYRSGHKWPPLQAATTKQWKRKKLVPWNFLVFFLPKGHVSHQLGTKNVKDFHAQLQAL